jgi:hypothetical protein
MEKFIRTRGTSSTSDRKPVSAFEKYLFSETILRQYSN